MDPLVIPIVAILMPLVLVPTILVMKFRHQRRKWEHLERLKAMETQLPIPLRQAIAGAGGRDGDRRGVPAVSVLGAFLTTLLWDSPVASDAAIVPVFAWSCAAVISALALVTSLRLASMSRDAAHEAELSAAISDGKPVYDPDAFDVVSSRG